MEINEARIVTLLNGVYHQSCQGIFIPMDIIYIIINYVAHILDMNMYIIAIRYDQEIVIHDIALNTNRFFDITPIVPIQPHSSPMHRQFPNHHHKITPHQYCFISNKNLPYHCYQTICSDSKILNLKIANQNWTLVANIGGTFNENHFIQGNSSTPLLYFGYGAEESKDVHYTIGNPTNSCSLTAIHPYLGDDAINLPIPSIPIEFTNPNVIYSNIHNKMYIMNHKDPMHGKYIYSLDMSSTLNKINNIWRWEFVTDTLKYKRRDTSICMVDQDKYIAILGGKDLNGWKCNKVELYSLQCNTTIDLASMPINSHATNGSSVYHAQNHQIISVSPSYNLTVYEINKDHWHCSRVETPRDYGSRRPQRVYLSSSNPNVLYCLASIKPENYAQLEMVTFVTKIDLRNNSFVEEDRKIFEKSDLPNWGTFLYANMN